MLESFHPAVRAWFGRRFPAGPTEPQAAGWREIAAGRHTLIAAPTGSGKTLAAFLVCIDRLYRAHEAGEAAGAGAAGGLRVAAEGAGDRHPAEPGGAAGARSPRWPASSGCAAPEIRVAVRTGDTAAAERAAMLKHPPDILITTPESLYLLVTAERSRAMLRSARTVIVDEIHAVAGNKRGSHLALTLERLEHVADGAGAAGRACRPPSGRSRPWPGCWSARARTATTRTGRRGARSWTPGTAGSWTWPWSCPTTSSARCPPAEQMAEILDLIAGHVAAHRTTLVFVNTRRMAERVAHQLGERLGDELARRSPRTTAVLSRGRRQRVEARLRAGDLRALVATASLELGHRHRAGRAGVPDRLAAQLRHLPAAGGPVQPHPHRDARRAAVPDHRATSWWSAPRCCAACGAGRLDAIVVPATAAGHPGPADGGRVRRPRSGRKASCSALVRRAAPFRDLSAEDFDDVAELLAEGIRDRPRAPRRTTCTATG